MRTLFIVCLLGLTVSSCKYKADSLPEEILEEVIKANLGVSLDLTPGSPEN